MKVLDSEFAKKFIELADNGWQMRYHERNGGNLSYRIPDDCVEQVREDLDMSGAWLDIGTEVPALAGEFFMVTGSGKYFSDIKNFPEDTCCIVEVSADGKKYRVVWGLCNGGRPTSELPTHLMNHEVKKLCSGGKIRVIYHCHPANIIAMTFVLPLSDKAFSRALWESMTECPVIFPEGVGVVPWMVCGGRDIAVATAEKMKNYNIVIWAHHGVFCVGQDFNETFGLAHTVEKSAEIYVKVRSMGGEKLQTIEKQNFIDLEGPFGIKINRDFLD